MKKLKIYADIFIQSFMLGSGVAIGAILVVKISNLL
jgi:acetylornithine/succinyldiaminopimelate/putrescine aminotransferase